MSKQERRLDRIPFDRQQYLRTIVRERVGCVVQQLLFHALAAIMAEEGMEVSTHRKIVADAAIDDLIWTLEQQWSSPTPPTVLTGAKATAADAAEGFPPATPVPDISKPPKRKARKGGGTVVDRSSSPPAEANGMTPGVVSVVEELANGTRVEEVGRATRDIAEVPTVADDNR